MSLSVAGYSDRGPPAGKKRARAGLGVAPWWLLEFELGTKTRVAGPAGIVLR